MQEPAVLYEVEERIAAITLNRPDNRNSMTDEVLEGLEQVLDRVQADPEVRAVVIEGRGRCFCAGADFNSGAQRDPGPRPLQPHERSFAMYQPFLRVLDLDVPVIGALNGHAVGGGLGLALVCDMRVANREARYGANFTRLGLHPGMATTWLLPRLLGLPRASELLFTGRLIDGAEAARIGLVNEAVAPEAVHDAAWALARECAAAAPLATRWTKRSLRRHAQWHPQEAAEHEALLQARTLETRDHREGVAALLEKREPDFEGQ